MSFIRRNHVAYIAIGIVLLVVGWRVSTMSSGTGVPGDSQGLQVGTTTYHAPPVPPTPPAMVHVVGKVRHPGVYRVPGGARLADVLRRAGGPVRGADLQAVNLAAVAVDGQQVIVPAKTHASSAARAPSTGSHGSTTPAIVTNPVEGPISLSSATAEQLETLDGIGPTLAQRIIAWRDENGGFRAVDDLTQVSGIGESRLAAIRDRVVP